MGVTVALALAGPASGGRLFAAWVLLVYGALVGLAWRSGDRVLGRLLVASTLMGLVELAADWWLVDGGAHVLFYPQEPTNLWCSPGYMPLLWASLPLCLCFVAAAFIPRFGRWPVGLATAAVGFGLAVFWESLTFYFHAWRYEGPVPMVGRAPLFIVMGEVTFLPALTLTVHHLVRAPASRWRPVLAGLLLGLFIWANYAAWFAVL